MLNKVYLTDLVAMRSKAVIFFLFLSICASGQSSDKPKGTIISANLPLSDSVYYSLSPYKLIMVGEMHGTTEPANFVMNLSDLFLRHGDTVQIGMEIPADMMTAYISNKTDSNIYHSDFFIRGFDDGRSSISWAEIIVKSIHTSNLSVFFFDANKNEGMDDNNIRDSMMYLKIKRNLIEHPNWRTITLSGNAHNLLMENGSILPVGFRLFNDSSLWQKGKMCSLLHWFQKGSMLNNSGSGLTLKVIDRGEDSFSRLATNGNYIYLYPAYSKYSYTGVYFTKYATAAKILPVK